ncbi:MAG: hypothetical protein N2043_04795, partial [Ignavibacterium sp.]|nr:hypothetical protein [Ignavibacterium sp.]
MKNIFFISVITLTNSIAPAQTGDSFTDFEKSRQDINENAMLVLGSWAVGNILIGTYGNFKSKNEAKYFHQFNAMWNVVNLGIAAFGYYSAVNSDISTMTKL